MPIAISTSRTREAYNRPPRWPLAINEDSDLAEGLLVAYPFFVGSRVAFWSLADRTNPYELAPSTTQVWTPGEYGLGVDAENALNTYAVLQAQVDDTPADVDHAECTWHAHARLDADSGGPLILMDLNREPIGASLGYFPTPNTIGYAVNATGGSLTELQSTTTFTPQADIDCVATFDAARTNDMELWVNGASEATGNCGASTLDLTNAAFEVLLDLLAANGSGGAARTLSGATAPDCWGGPLYRFEWWGRRLRDIEIEELSTPDGRWGLYAEVGRRLILLPAATGGANPHNPLGHPLAGAFGGPI